ncbi:MAG: NACHT domain-containing protein, partial [Planctomycetaceae bacterium]
MCEKLKSGLPAQAIAEPAVPATPENDENAPNNDRSAKLADVDIPIPQSVGHFQEGLAERTTTEAKVISPESDGAHVAIDELMVWARRDPKNVEPFLAILGEYGIGKTTLLQTFARRLKAERATDPSLPVPVYIDLRLMSVPAEGEMPSLKELLSGFIHNCWKSSGNNDSSLTPDTLTPDSVITLVREHNAIVIFDGLDEKTNAMRPERAQEFLRRLWSCLPDAALRMRLIKDKQKTNEKVVRTKAVEEPATRGRMIISCRSHYFRDITSQSSMLRGEDREQIDGYPALILVPWNEQTIRNYLAERLGSEERSANAISLIKSVHNLRDLAERPYLLHLITGNLGELERAASEGETINAARLYQMITGEWLERDQGKHQISRPHKKLLMEQLALALHREGERSWDVDKLEDWLDQFLIQNPAIERNAAVSDVRILKEDLRAATFVVRPDQQDGNRFQFAHTSLQEFFIASALVDSLDKQDGSAWDLPRVSHETFDFVGQLIEVASPRERERMLETLGNVMGREPFKAAELAFRY